MTIDQRLDRLKREVDALAARAKARHPRISASRRESALEALEKMAARRRPALEKNDRRLARLIELSKKPRKR